MPLRQDVLFDRRFWAWLYGVAFGQAGAPAEAAAVCSLLDVNEQDALDWGNAFTGWYPGIFDKSDGCVDDPARIEIALANGVQLRAEFHPGDLYWFLQRVGDSMATLANIGPHFSLPGLRWQEAVALGDAAPRDGWAATLLSLPVVWLTPGDDEREARNAAKSAWLASNLVDAELACRMAELWVQAAESGGDYNWTHTTAGWLCDAEWSTRSEGRDGAGLLNRLLALAGGA